MTTAEGAPAVADNMAADVAERHQLWILISDASERDGYWLKPDPWTGPGEYQRCTLNDGRGVLRAVRRRP